MGSGSRKCISIRGCGSHSQTLALLGRGINDQEDGSLTRDAGSYRSSLNEKASTLANVEIVACDALETNAPDRFAATMIAAHILMAHIFVDVVN